MKRKLTVEDFERVEWDTSATCEECYFNAKKIGDIDCRSELANECFEKYGDCMLDSDSSNYIFVLRKKEGKMVKE